ncbi:Urease accessory protein UreE [Methylobacterium crusticola]|uniref:Urease accessory protein UreE n=1 Tax=Methylobacterium crusticola TaxID=1697972 RepID=A0ABQ4QRK7_9HYPH|nr:urease accessory protein UreE [Methylobacterium crusticola]GJD47956.1 Urease accessory protein UreE [Methylobacterium crusticola]
MLRATTIVRKPAVRPDAVVDTVALDHAARTRSEADLTAAGGLAFRLSLGRAATLEDGDAVRLDDGRLVRIAAAAQSLLEIRAGNPARLTRLAWQLGSNHVQAEITADALYVLADPAVAELVRGQGCTAAPVERAFRPEREAAAHDHSQCGHDHHGHDHHDHRHHDHDHAEPAPALHGHAPDAHAHPAHGPAGHVHGPAGHVHGPGCGHDH